MPIRSIVLGSGGASPHLISTIKFSAYFLSRGIFPSSRSHHRTFSSTSGDDILLRNDDTATGITSLTLNNPKRYNVLSWEMLDKLQYQLDNIAKDTVRIYMNFCPAVYY